MLTVSDLSIAFGAAAVVRGLSFTLARGEILGIVGESGAGKSITSLCLMGLLPPQAMILNGSANFADGDETYNLAALDGRTHRALRGRKLSLVFQEPLTCLNPSMRCGEQLLEAVIANTSYRGKSAKEICLALLADMQLPDPMKIYRSYPHQISGGQKQRVMIAMALAGSPQLLIADEPTTALDVTVQKGILALLKQIRAKYGVGIIFISHDLGVIREIADKVLVMHNGEVVEQGPVDNVFANPMHPYTAHLIGCRRTLSEKKDAKPIANQSAPAIFSARGITVRYDLRKNIIGKPTQSFTAVNNVSIDLYEGETLGVVGESGSGKTTLGRTLLRLIGNQSGSILYRGKNLRVLNDQELKRFRKEVQLIFQDPYSSLNPRLTIEQTLTEPLKVHRILTSPEERKRRVLELLDRVMLPRDSLYRYPHEFSGGQRQRIVIARALTLYPRVLICDEIVSALDVSIQAQILELLQGMKRELNLTYLFISHDLSVVRYISDRVLVLRNGVAVETGKVDDVYANPHSDYTKALIDSIPVV